MRLPVEFSTDVTIINTEINDNPTACDGVN
jgi:hypothetical protein